VERIHAARTAYVLFAWGIVAALLAQVSLIGLWLFSGQPTLYFHKEFGHLIFLMVFALLILAFVGRLPSPLRLATAALSVITSVQTEVFALLPGSPLRAFHTVLPLVIFFLAAFLALRATSVVRVRLAQAVPPLPIGESRAD
jgi:Family of unknown function (DUF6220)